MKFLGQDTHLRILPQPFFLAVFIHVMHDGLSKIIDSLLTGTICVKIELLLCSFLFKICIELCMPFTSNAEAASKRNAGESWKRSFISTGRPYYPLVLLKNGASRNHSLKWRNLETPASCFNSKLYLLDFCGSNATIIVKQILTVVVNLAVHFWIWLKHPVHLSWDATQDTRVR